MRDIQRRRPTTHLFHAIQATFILLLALALILLSARAVGLPL